MTDDLEAILQRVASGELSVAEAEPLIAAATAQEAAGDEQPQRKSGRFGWPRPPAAPEPPVPPAMPGSAEGEAQGRMRDHGNLRPAPQYGERAQRIVRLQVLEGGRAVVNLRIPTTWAGLAGSVLPGLSNEHAQRLRDAIRAGTVGRILEVQDEDGDGVIISTE